MTRFILAYGALALALGQAPSGDLGYTDTPMLPGLPYRVHDPARPHPPEVRPAAQAGDAPSDAIVLFNGRDLSSWQPVRPPGRMWKVESGYFEVVPGAGDLATKQSFGDVQLHIEWAAPAQIQGTGQNRGNSGVFLQGRYEVQVLDSFDNPTYADGQAGALYGQWPPLVNPARKPSEWQSYDIVFEAPRMQGDRVIRPAFITVFLNGVLLHHHRELMGPTVHRALAQYKAQPAEAPLVLQDHAAPVRYRNIWIRPIGVYDRSRQ